MEFCSYCVFPYTQWANIFLSFRNSSSF
jgi:hypothetical protein